MTITPPASFAPRPLPKQSTYRERLNKKGASLCNDWGWHEDEDFGRESFVKKLFYYWMIYIDVKEKISLICFVRDAVFTKFTITIIHTEVHCLDNLIFITNLSCMINLKAFTCLSKFIHFYRIH